VAQRANGYFKGYNGRRPFTSVLVVEPDELALAVTVQRYLARFSFVVAALPARAAAVAALFRFDGIVLPASCDLVLPGPRFQIDDPIRVARELRAVAKCHGRPAA